MLHNHVSAYVDLARIAATMSVGHGGDSLPEGNVRLWSQIRLDGEVREVAMQIEGPLRMRDFGDGQHLEKVLCRHAFSTHSTSKGLWQHSLSYFINSQQGHASRQSEHPQAWGYPAVHAFA